MYLVRKPSSGFQCDLGFTAVSFSRHHGQRLEEKQEPQTFIFISFAFHFRFLLSSSGVCTYSLCYSEQW